MIIGGWANWRFGFLSRATTMNNEHHLASSDYYMTAIRTHVKGLQKNSR